MRGDDGDGDNSKSQDASASGEVESGVGVEVVEEDKEEITAADAALMKDVDAVIDAVDADAGASIGRLMLHPQ